MRSKGVDEGMSVEQNLRMVEAAFEAINDQDWDHLWGLHVDNIVMSAPDLPDPVNGREADMTILSTWRPHRWSQSWSLMASNAASTIRRFCSTLIPSSTPLLRIVSGVFRLDERERDGRPVKDPEPAGACGEKPRSAGGLTR